MRRKEMRHPISVNAQRSPNWTGICSDWYLQPLRSVGSAHFSVSTVTSVLRQKSLGVLREESLLCLRRTRYLCAPRSLDFVGLNK